MDDDRYGSDVLSGDWRSQGVKKVRQVPLERDMVLEDPDSGWAGAVVGLEAGNVSLEDWKGRTRAFPFTGQFLLEGELVTLGRPQAPVGRSGGARPAAGPTGGAAVPAGRIGAAPAVRHASDGGRLRTASGSFAVEQQRARVALPSRIMVEGRHDAELVEKVWGADLRVEGVVVEYLEGVDNLAEVLDEFRPSRDRRVGVLVDHLVPGSKESRFADAVMRGKWGAHVLVVGHPFVDVWQSVKPSRLGLTEWPTIPRSIEWKKGILQHLGWPADEQADVARAWQRILGQVRTFADLEPQLLGRVEELIDFVTEPKA
ncbi:hypothetical protein GCM10009706_08680 [Curtobacterium citreum]|uniref:DUF3097 domain-containing protein n=2 Tax=Curtobacterium TaxID=2034 RepID=A0ABT2HF52_9MICO|nr:MULTISPECIES: DUF3097 domain-containing protein [Curtobacterium]MCS6521893.1 DUF3097 domain-containing protein [Curtobacterium citreum]TQJ27285.1 DUF3097 family protein [Curtobacterium citreum]GGL72592.1 hypothetical protein GCM10009706_08680 [Curtobacterium citreum]